jgi:predicted DNA-binding protein
MRYHESVARRCITIELEEDEYRRLEALASRTGMAPDRALRWLIERSGEPIQDEEDDSPAAVAKRRAQWREFLDAAEELRKKVKPWGPGELDKFLQEVRAERDARP